jgi:hypothetical protein
LYNLSDFLPKKPGEVELRVIKEMFEASVDGEAYDMDRWGQYFKPAGMSQATGDPIAQSKPTPAPLANNSNEEDDEPAAAAPVATQEAPASGGGRAEDILAMIRNRKSA